MKRVLVVAFFALFIGSLAFRAVAPDGSGRGAMHASGPTGRAIDYSADIIESFVVASAQPDLTGMLSAVGVAVSRGLVFDRQLESQSLAQSFDYIVYLPPGYDESTARYPVLYMLHGYGAGPPEWMSYGIFVTADRLIATKEIQPLIIVLLDGRESYWLNHAGGGERWGDYVARDVVAHVDATYRTLPQPAHRAIGGHSMGGHGALQIAMNYPDVFGVAGAHSPTLRALDAPEPYQAYAYFGDPEYFATIDPISLARTGTAVEQIRLWIDHGDADEWGPRVDLLRETLLERGITYEYHVWSGGHAGEYWMAHVDDYLRYYGRAMATSA